MSDELATADKPIWLDTFGGKVFIEWDPAAAVTPLGQAPFFVAFLKAGGLYDPWVEDCPLSYTSPNAPSKRDVLGPMFLSILSGHRRYAHVTGLRGDGVSPELLGMKKVASEDSVRRSFQASAGEACAAWATRHLDFCAGPLLHEPWILDVDTTVKPLYGRQAGAEIGYNPSKPGRPSHTYHPYFVANLRLVLDVEVQAGNRSAALYSRPGMWSLLDRRGRNRWPRFVRGDCAWGSEGPMRECEDRGLDYLFKVRQTAKVRRLIERLFGRRDWADAGHGWEGIEDRLLLSGWSASRRVVVLRRRLRDDVALAGKGKSGQMELAFIECGEPVAKYEYAVLATSLSEPILTVAQVYNWWSLFVRLAIPDRHAEAITSRPLLLDGVGKLTRHAGQTKVTITSLHGKEQKRRTILILMSRFFHALDSIAEQLSREERWRWLLSAIFREFLGGRLLSSPPLLEFSG